MVWHFHTLHRQLIFHIEMGWGGINDFNPESMWIWSEEKGWVWTTRNLLPFFTQIIHNWLYILLRELEVKRFYNYDQSSRIIIHSWPSLSGLQDYLANKSPYCSKAFYHVIEVDPPLPIARSLKHISTIRSPCGSKSMRT